VAATFVLTPQNSTNSDVLDWKRGEANEICGCCLVVGSAQQDHDAEIKLNSDRRGSSCQMTSLELQDKLERGDLFIDVFIGE
jgi:hypothetical protein